MLAPCVVPSCTSNYRNGHKRKVYSFPQNEVVLQKWITAIHRENFVPTKYNKVCELHFKDTDFITTSKVTDAKTGKIIEAALKIRRLHPDAVPSQFPDLLHYLSSNKTLRESPESKRKRVENERLNKAIEASVEAIKEYEDSRQFSNLNKLQELLDLVDKNYWTVVSNGTHVMFIHITVEPAPTIKKSLVIKENLEINYYSNGLTLEKTNKFSFPYLVKNIDILNDILNDLKALDEKSTETLTFNILSITNALKSLKSFDHINETMLKFIIEQISFLYCNKHAFRYSSDTLIFATLFYTISPQAYRFIRKSSFLNLPHPNTVKRLCTSYDLDPHSEQIEANFLH